jgi:hypothetical protein
LHPCMKKVSFSLTEKNTFLFMNPIPGGEGGDRPKSRNHVRTTY